MLWGIPLETMDSERDETLTFLPVMSWPVDVLIFGIFSV